MLQTNPEIDHIVAEATDLAKNLNHEYVTLEHVFLSMIRFDPFRDLLAQFGADVNSLDADLEAYLLQATNLIVSDLEPKKTHALERTFNRALTQVLFS
jgi:ATP-dependent Clp protease ATP-binding subunit ClpA